MKYLAAIFMVIALASCGANKETNTDTSKNTNTSLTEEVKAVSEEVSKKATDETKVEKIDMSYKNPSGQTAEVSFSYTLDADKKIDSISFEWYSHNGFFEKAEKEIVWKTIEEASNIYVSGASLASEAFRTAIKKV